MSRLATDKILILSLALRKTCHWWFRVHIARLEETIGHIDKIPLHPVNTSATIFS